MSGSLFPENSQEEQIPRKTIYQIMQMKPIKLELGGGARPTGGYINVDMKDIPEVDYVADISTLDDFVDGSIDAILAKDVLQCFHRDEVVTILRRWFRKMRRSTRLVIQVPDMKQLFNLYSANKVCNCWDSSTKKADPTCTRCEGQAVMNYDRFQACLHGRNRPNESFKSAFDITDLTTLIEKSGFTVLETQEKELRILVIAKKIPKKEQ